MGTQPLTIGGRWWPPRPHERRVMRIADNDRPERLTRVWQQKGATERALIMGLHGAPQLRRSERRRLLGEFAERVLASITKTQAGQDQIDRDVAEAMKDPRAVTVVAHMDVPFAHVLKYSRLADEHNLTFTRRSDAAFSGDVGLVVVSDQAL